MPEGPRFRIEHLVGERTTRQMAHDLKLSTRTVERWIADGVDWEQADRFAARVLRTAAFDPGAFGEEWEAAADAACNADQQTLFDDF
jgi:hypothetical protein